MVLGVTFLTDYYTIYDMNNADPRIGFIEANPGAGVLTFERFLFVFAAAVAALAILSCGCFCCCCCLCKPCRVWKERKGIRYQAKLDATFRTISLMNEDKGDQILNSQHNLPKNYYNQDKYGFDKDKLEKK